MVNVTISYDINNKDCLLAFKLFKKYNKRYNLTSKEKSDIEIILAIDEELEDESYSLKRNGNKVFIIGGDSLGLIYGIGKIIHRNINKIKDGYIIPRKRIRGIYFATHFYNYYQSAPIEKINNYLEELTLWGCNCISAWFDMHHFKSINDKEAVELLQRIKFIYASAKKLGLKVCLGTLANEYYEGAPEELLATNEIEGTDYFYKPGGYYNTEICPSIPAGKNLIISSHNELLEFFSEILLDYIWLWPYDQGGCTCPKCRPWGSNGFVEISKALSTEIKKTSPETKVILSTWRFDTFTNGEWEKFLDSYNITKNYFDILMVDLESPYIPEKLYKMAENEEVEIIGFPEISMLTAVPWGGFGATPVPYQLELSYNKNQKYHSGGFAYSEGFFEDINKVAMLSMYFSDEPISEIMDDYFGYYFSDGVVMLGAKLLKCLESSLARNRLNDKGIIDDYPTEDVVNYSPKFKIADTQEIERAYELANIIRDMLPLKIAQSDRFMMLFLRAVIDKALKDNNGETSEITENAANELEKIYHAENADYAVSPITKKAIKENRGHI